VLLAIIETYRKQSRSAKPLGTKAPQNPRRRRSRGHELAETSTPLFPLRRRGASDDRGGDERPRAPLASALSQPPSSRSRSASGTRRLSPVLGVRRAMDLRSPFVGVALRCSELGSWGARASSPATPRLRRRAGRSPLRRRRRAVRAAREGMMVSQSRKSEQADAGKAVRGGVSHGLH